MKKHVVLYSHGFGVRKDDRGLFTDIAASMPQAEHVLFDYNHIDDTKNTLSVSPLSVQVRKLKEQLDMLDKDAVVDIVAHSQGCLVAALAKPVGMHSIVCIAPPDNVDTDRLIAFFGSREGSVINLDGTSKVPRRDGSTTLIPATYWQSLRHLNVIRIYNRLPALAKTTFIIANDDEVLGMSNFDQTDEAIELIQIPGNHDFTGEYRDGLVRHVGALLA